MKHWLLFTGLFCMAASAPAQEPAQLIRCPWFWHVVVFEGETATYSVDATGTPPLHYQWGNRNGPIPEATNALPAVAWVFPTDGWTYAVGSTILLRARATDSDGTVSFVDFFATPPSGAPINLDRATGGSAENLYSGVWYNAPVGQFRLHAEAVDNAGGRGISGSVQIAVIGTNPPSIGIDQPSNGDSFQAPADIKIVAGTVDADGWVPKVEFFANGAKIGESTINFITPPPDGTFITHEFDWTGVGVGDYVLIAHAIDDEGASRRSLPVQISVTDSNAPTRTVVSIVATDPEGREIPEVPPGMHMPQVIDPAIFTVSRSANFDNELIVYYRVSGTASNGVDYVEIPGEVKIPAGARSANIEIDVIDDLLFEGTENVIIQLVPPVCPAIYPPPPECYLVGAMGDQRVLTFDDFSLDPLPAKIPVPNGYGGLTWQYFAVANGTSADPQSGYNRGAISPSNVVFNPSGGPAIIRSPHGTFDLGSAYFTFALTPADYTMSVRVTGFAAGTPVYENTVTVGRNPSLWHFNYRGVDEVSFHPSPFWPFVLDNLTLAVNPPSRAEARIIDNDSAPSNRPPVVTWLQPPDGSTFPARSTILLRARATDSDGTVSFVEFYANTSILGRVSFGASDVYTFAWSNAPAGSFRLHAQAVDNAGGRGFSDSVQITVVSTSQPPNIQIVRPANGANFQAANDIEIVAETVDPDGWAPTVEFFANGAKIGESTIHFITPPPDGTPITHEFEWEGVGLGDYVLTARAIDDQGATRTSQPVRISVTDSPAQEPAQLTRCPWAWHVSIFEGETATYSVDATGTPPLHYQWGNRNGPIPDATNATFTITNATFSDAGYQYWVSVTNVSGADYCYAIRLTVLPVSPIPGFLDGSFHAPFGALRAVILQPDGRILIGGNNVKRLLPDGRVDPTFAQMNGSVTQMALASDGKIVINGLVRLNPDGTRDSSFAPPSRGTVRVLAMGLQPDGKVAICYQIRYWDRYGEERWLPPVLERLNTDGSLDNSFQPSPPGPVSLILVLADGILVATESRLVRLLPDGRPDSTFVASALDGPIVSMALQADSKILVGGAFSLIQGEPRSHIARLHPDGRIDPTFDPPVNTGDEPTVVRALAVQDDGKILVGGNFRTMGEHPREALARLHSDGSLDTTFVAGIGLLDDDETDNVYSIIIQSPQTALVGGWLSRYWSVDVSGLIRIFLEPQPAPPPPEAPILSIDRQPYPWAQRLHFQSQLGRWYRVEEKNEFPSNDWAGVGAILLGNGDILTIPLISPRFYGGRVRLCRLRVLL